VFGGTKHHTSEKFEKTARKCRFLYQPVMFLARIWPFTGLGPGWHGPCDMSFEPNEKLTN
jgi:hypothetical protein